MVRAQTSAPGRSRCVVAIHRGPPCPVSCYAELDSKPRPAFQAADFKRPTSSSRHGPAAVREQQPPHFGGRYRGAEQITLHLGAAEDVEQIPLLLGFDA